MWLVVGLGNPGRRYRDTRHNVGFVVVHHLAERWGFPAVARSQLGAEVGEGMVDGVEVVTCLPQSFMNRSGQPVHSLAGYYQVPPERVLVVHDDLDLGFGALRCKQGGGHGGHNGLRDIIRLMGADFPRVRFGIGRPPEGVETADHVLAPWLPDEAGALPPLVDRTCEAAQSVLTQGALAAMNRYNARAAP